MLKKLKLRIKQLVIDTIAEDISHNGKVKRLIIDTIAEDISHNGKVRQHLDNARFARDRVGRLQTLSDQLIAASADAAGREARGIIK